MRVSTLEKKLKNHNEKQFVDYVKCHWCKHRKQPLLDMLEEMELEFDIKQTMDELIIKFRKEITDYMLEAYYGA